ncbi:unnamed protein product [Rotaria sp. Silwood1]|nr:unnamed protein product [Rotaria sp. Silwood1]CAF3586185.1 unnamed protein product [Rotaria sp. Silwood1]CAF3601903.1 unnamed protein product [Rotaria sp. Silwood1]CAF4561728.1 unnamed protein product [Rotaria sp. Silwood1]CAF4688769.1 unnamed protein product [Rotaria sp. Silwood1]
MPLKIIGAGFGRTGTESEAIYKESNECPGGLVWNKRGTTVIGNGIGSGPDQLYLPNGIFIEPKTHILYVADIYLDYLFYGGNGAGINPYQLNGPTGLYYDEQNQILYLSNEQSHSITQWVLGDYEPRNIYAGIPGRSGNSAAQLFYPEGITLDKYGNLYVTDTSNHRIQMFFPDAILGITIADVMPESMFVLTLQV